MTRGTTGPILRLMMNRRGALLFASAVLLACSPSSGGAASQDPSLAGLPLVEVPARADSGTIAILMSGDGGWVDIDQGVAAQLAAHGIGVVGLNSRAYLGRRRSPEQVTADVARIARVYMARWHADRLVIAGYSRGADLVPFVANRLPPDLRPRVALLAMFGLGRAANFQFHWMDVITDTKRPDDVPVLPELERLRGKRMLCVYGTEEPESGCRDAEPALITRVARPGGHHFDGNFRGLADLIIAALRPASP